MWICSEDLWLSIRGDLQSTEMTILENYFSFTLKNMENVHLSWSTLVTIVCWQCTGFMEWFRHVPMSIFHSSLWTIVYFTFWTFSIRLLMVSQGPLGNHYKCNRMLGIIDYTAACNMQFCSKNWFLLFYWALHNWNDLKYFKMWHINGIPTAIYIYKQYLSAKSAY